MMSGSFKQRRREDPDAEPCRIQGNPGLDRVHVPQSATIDQSELVVGLLCGSVSTNFNTGGGDAPIAVVGTHDVNSGSNFNGACRDSLTSLSITCARRCVDRNRTAVRRFGDERIATHARHSE